MTVKLFGITKEIIGGHHLSVPPSDNIKTVGDLKHWLAQHYPAMQKLKSVAVAVDSEYADDAQALTTASEIALIPPVSGG